MKQCRKCLALKEEVEFLPKRNHCKACRAAQKREWDAANKEANKQKRKVYLAENAERIRNTKQEYNARNAEAISAYNKQRYQQAADYHRERSRRWHKENKDRATRRIVSAHLLRRKMDPEYKLKCNMRTAIWDALKYKKAYKFGKTHDLLGCTGAQLKEYIERQFTGEMSWSNYGSYWHVDHIIPIALFDLKSEDEQKAAFNYTNLRPCEASENLAKQDKIFIDLRAI